MTLIIETINKGSQFLRFTKRKRKEKFQNRKEQIQYVKERRGGKKKVSIHQITTEP